MAFFARCLCGAFLLSLSVPLSAQQEVPLRGGIPVAPQGLRVPPLPEGPVFYETAEGQNIRVSVYVRGLERPWSLAFVGDGLRVIRDGVLDPEPVAWDERIPALGIRSTFSWKDSSTR